MSSVGVIILAAGNSSRLGRPKQLLSYRGRTLVTYVVGEALAAGLRPLVVVTGAYCADVEAALKGEPVGLVYNPDWETGMASGIVAGLSNILLLHPDLKAVVISVCDQPFISAALLSQLARTFETSGKGIVASAYADSMGTPVLFGSSYFEVLLSLSGSEGAKKLLRQHPADLATVSFPGGDIDMDTAEDLRKLE
jgi:CTP:molybdopterin cytidylyltransferase MocA